jgi:hypothetical protein
LKMPLSDMGPPSGTSGYQAWHACALQSVVRQESLIYSAQ